MLSINIKTENLINAFISSPKVDFLPHFFFLVSEEKNGIINVINLTLGKVFEIKGTPEDVAKISDSLCREVTFLSIQYLYENYIKNGNNFKFDTISVEYWQHFNEIILNKKLKKLENSVRCIKELEDLNLLFKEDDLLQNFWDNETDKLSKILEVISKYKDN